MIRNQQAFPDEGIFYKGNLHCHTTQSDGQATPSERVAEYRQAGYDFLALTDHWVYSDFTEYTDEHFLLLPGVELDCPPNERETITYHTVGIGLPGKNSIPAGRVETGNTIEEQLAFLRNHGNIAIAAHPYWSQTDMEAFLGLKGICGLEVYNSVCDAEFGTGFSEGYWDHAIRRGWYPLAFASDDYHASAFRSEPDHFVGYIKVKAAALTHGAILDSILNGHFFASHAGPDIMDFRIEDGKAIVETAPCRQISLRSPHSVGYQVHEYNNNLTHAAFSLTGREQVIRAVVTDAYGRSSWTQLLPITVE